MKYWRIYLVFIKNSFAQFSAARFDLFMSGMANIVWTVSQLILFSFFIKKVDSVGGWNFYEMALFLALGQVYFYTSYIFYRSSVQHIIVNSAKGQLDFLLLKPAPKKFMLFFQQIAVAQIMPSITTVLPLLIWSILKLKYSFSEIAYIALIMAIGQVIMFYITTICTALSINQSNGEQNFEELIISNAASFMQLPFNIYPTALIFVLSYIVPIGFVAYLPIKAVKTGQNYLETFALALLVAAVAIMLDALLWRNVWSKYTGAA